MYKYLHLGFTGDVFINKQEDFNEDVICKSQLVNMLLSITGDTPISSYYDTIVNECLKSGDVDLQIYDMFKNIVDLSFYKINNIITYYTKKGVKKYVTEFRSGLRDVKPDSGKNKTKVGKYIFNATTEISLDRIKSLDGYYNDKDAFNDLCDIIKKHSGLIPYKNGLKNIIINIHNIVDKTVLIRDIETHKCKYPVKYGQTYRDKFLKFLYNPESIAKYNEKTNMFDVDIRLDICCENNKRKQVFVKVKPKTSIPVIGELYVPINDEIYNKLKNYYSPCTLLDGGGVFIKDIIDEDDFNSKLVINKGFKSCSTLKNYHKNESKGIIY